MSDALSAVELDLAVARAMGNDSAEINHRRVATRWPGGPPFAPSTDWAIAGPIIERERISTRWSNDTLHGVPRPEWQAELPCLGYAVAGPTPLIAAMRAFVASKTK